MPLIQPVQVADGDGKSLASDTLSGICNILACEVLREERQRPPQDVVHAFKGTVRTITRPLLDNEALRCRACLALYSAMRGFW
jgi:hypothetical protein